MDSFKFHGKLYEVANETNVPHRVVTNVSQDIKNLDKTITIGQAFLNEEQTLDGGTQQTLQLAFDENQLKGPEGPQGKVGPAPEIGATTIEMYQYDGTSPTIEVNQQEDSKLNFNFKLPHPSLSVGNIYTVSVNDNIATKTYVDNKAQAEATAAYTQAVTNLTGAASDAVTAITIYGARNYAKDLTDKLSAALTGLSAAHLELIEQIKREIENPDGASGIIETFLDKLLTVGAGFNGIDGGTTGVTGTIKNYIDSNETALSTAIANAQNNANSSIKSVNGLTGDTNGAVIVGATDVLMTNYTAATGAVASTDSVLTAIAKVEQHSIDGVNAAATAQASANIAINNAATAQTTADKAINLLSWVII